MPVFFLAMIEATSRLLCRCAAHNDFFGVIVFARVLLWGTLGGFCQRTTSPLRFGRRGSKTVRTFVYRGAQESDGAADQFVLARSQFLFSKYIYGLRWASCTFLWRRTDALRAFLASLTSQLFPVGCYSQRRRLFLQQRGSGIDWRLSPRGKKILLGIGRGRSAHIY